MRKVIHIRFATVAVLSFVAVLSSAACSTTPTNTNTRGTPTATPSPTATPMSGMSNMNGNMNGNMGGMDMESSPNAASQPYDLQFLDTMTAHHRSAVDMARPAVTKAQHAELKTFAQKIITDQEGEIAEMRRYREQWYAGKPPAINMEMSGMMDSMRGIDMNKMNTAMGNEYDVMFLDMMMPHHAGATAMAKEALTKAEHPEIKRLAQKIIDAQEREIGMMNKWKDSWR